MSNAEQQTVYTADRSQFNALAALVARRSRNPEALTVVSLAATLDGGLILEHVVSTLSRRLDLHQLKHAGAMDAVILAKYRPERPDPCAGDLLELGRILSSLPFHDKHGAPRDVAIGDFLIVDGDGNALSVLAAYDLGEHFTCPHCAAWQYPSDMDLCAPGPESRDPERHAPGCPRGRQVMAAVI